jgi:hypothetical protein
MTCRDFGIQCIALRVSVNRHRLFMDVSNSWITSLERWTRDKTEIEWRSRAPKKWVLRRYVELLVREEGEKFLDRFCRSESVHN